MNTSNSIAKAKKLLFSQKLFVDNTLYPCYTNFVGDGYSMELRLPADDYTEEQLEKLTLALKRSICFYVCAWPRTDEWWRLGKYMYGRMTHFTLESRRDHVKVAVCTIELQSMDVDKNFSTESLNSINVDLID